MKYFTLMFFYVICYQAQCRSLEPTKFEHSKDQTTLNEDRSIRVHRISDDHSPSSPDEDTQSLLPTDVSNEEITKQNSLADSQKSEDSTPLPESKSNEIPFESTLKGIHFHDEEDLQTQLQQFMKKLQLIFNESSEKESAMPMNDVTGLIMSMGLSDFWSDENMAKILPLRLDSLISGDEKRKIKNILHHLEDMFTEILN